MLVNSIQMKQLQLSQNIILLILLISAVDQKLTFFKKMCDVTWTVSSEGQVRAPARLRIRPLLPCALPLSHTHTSVTENEMRMR